MLGIWSFGTLSFILICAVSFVKAPVTSSFSMFFPAAHPFSGPGVLITVLLFFITRPPPRLPIHSASAVFIEVYFSPKLPAFICARQMRFDISRICI
jgi:hypothetical protein